MKLIFVLPILQFGRPVTGNIHMIKIKLKSPDITGIPIMGSIGCLFKTSRLIKMGRDIKLAMKRSRLAE